MWASELVSRKPSAADVIAYGIALLALRFWDSTSTEKQPGLSVVQESGHCQRPMLGSVGHVYQRLLLLKRILAALPVCHGCGYDASRMYCRLRSYGQIILITTR